MNKHTTWSYEHYVPIFGDEEAIYICRLAPARNSFTFDFKTREGEKYSVYYRERFGAEFILAGTTDSGSFTVSGLDENEEYEFYVSSGGRKSAVRLVRCGESFGYILNYLHPEDKYYPRGGQFLSSPSIIKHPDGYMLAAHDLFGGAGDNMMAFIYRSDDDGETWYHTCDLFPAYCAKLFIHKGEVYVLATTRSRGDLIIGKSTDGGMSFCLPTILWYGSGASTVATLAGVHKMTQPVVEYGGRIWAAMEWGSWSLDYHLSSFVASAPSDGDLLDANNWSFSEPLKYDPAWEGTAKRMNMLKDTYGTLENCLIEVKGKLISVARYEIEHCEPFRGKAIVYDVDTENPEGQMKFSRVIDHPGNHAKFVIKYDETRKKYYSLVNPLYTPANLDTRNLVTLISSDDCMEWKTEKTVYDYTEHSAKKVGIQYIDFEIIGDEIILLSRVGINGADSYHNSNNVIFDRIKMD